MSERRRFLLHIFFRLATLIMMVKILNIATALSSNAMINTKMSQTNFTRFVVRM